MGRKRFQNFPVRHYLESCAINQLWITFLQVSAFLWLICLFTEFLSQFHGILTEVFIDLSP